MAQDEDGSESPKPFEYAIEKKHLFDEFYSQGVASTHRFTPHEIGLLIMNYRSTQMPSSKDCGFQPS